MVGELVMKLWMFDKKTNMKIKSIKVYEDTYAVFGRW